MPLDQSPINETVSHNLRFLQLDRVSTYFTALIPNIVKLAVNPFTFHTQLSCFNIWQTALGQKHEKSFHFIFLKGVDSRKVKKILKRLLSR